MGMRPQEAIRDRARLIGHGLSAGVQGKAPVPGFRPGSPPWWPDTRQIHPGVSLLALHAERRRKALLAAVIIAEALVSQGLTPAAVQRLLTRLQTLSQAQRQAAERVLASGAAGVRA